MRRLRKIALVLCLLVAVGLVSFLMFAPGYVEGRINRITVEEPWPAVDDAAAALHAGLVIGDWHADSLLWDRDLLDRGTYGHVDLPRLIEGNVALQVFTAVTKSPAGQNYVSNSADAFDMITALGIGQLWPPRTWGSLEERALYQAARLHRFAERSDGQLRLITTVSELEQFLSDRAAGNVAVGAILGIEGGHALEGDLAALDRLEDVGYRLIGLQHFFDNELGTSLHGTGVEGLTDFGRQVAAEIVERGMILDLAHASPMVAREVIALTDIPLVVSHTGLASACQTPRNFPDALMQAIVANGAAAGGGVIGIGYWEDVLCDDSPDGIARTILAAIEVLGEDHVSLGSDFDGAVGTSIDASQIDQITAALLRAGASETQIEKVMGGNMLRVLRARLP